MNLNQLTSLLSRKQIRSIVESEQARISIWSGAVSSGKTISSLIALLIGIARAPDRGLILIVGRTLQTIERNIIEPLQDVELFGPAAAEVRHTRGATTAVILGRVVHLVGANDERAEGRIRGATAYLAYVDEATLVPEGFFTMLLSRLRVPGARLLCTTNPDGPAHWLRQKFLLRQHELNMASWHFTLDDNPSLEASYVSDLKAEYTGLWYQRYIEGQWRVAEGVVYEAWDPARHVIPAAKLPTITRWLALTLDYGTTNPFHALILGAGADGRLYVTNEWRWDSKLKRAALTDTEYSQRLRSWMAGLKITPEWTIIDPSAASFRVQMYRDGWSARLADNEVLDGIRDVASLFATGRLLVSDACPELIAEIPSYAWDPRASERGNDAPIKTADHGCDALRYGIRTTRGIWRGLLTNDITTAA